ncbi:MAG: hypothetical protein HC801_04525 [Nitrospira sp.]|nr:hypothetical protein [Nitrospira sp.]
MTIVIAAGGTGGHLYPAIALAREFVRRDPSYGFFSWEQRVASSLVFWRTKALSWC